MKKKIIVFTCVLSLLLFSSFSNTTNVDAGFCDVPKVSHSVRPRK